MTKEERLAEKSWESKGMWYNVSADHYSYVDGFLEGLKAGKDINVHIKWHKVSEQIPTEEKKLKVSDLKLGDIVRHKSRNLEYLVTGIDYDEEQVFFNGVWFDDADGDLGAWWEKVEND